jgi:hypothetical protein
VNFNVGLRGFDLAAAAVEILPIGVLPSVQKVNFHFMDF